MNGNNDDRLISTAGRLAKEVSPERDLWPGIEAAIARPGRSRWTPMLAQAAAVIVMIGASSMLTYVVVKDGQTIVERVQPALNAETVSFAGRTSLGAEYEQARGRVTSVLDDDLKRLSPDTRADVERNLAVIRHAIADINQALEQEPDSRLLQDLLADAYREEFTVMRRVGDLTQRVMSRQDI
jgi:hypothetical protein